MEFALRLSYKGPVLTPASSMRYLSIAALVLAGLVHLLPAIGAASSGRLAALYGIEATEPNLQLLLRHRAFLFGILGIAMLTSIWLPSLRTPALVAAVASVSSFLLLAWSIGGYNSALATVVRVDLVLLPVVVAGLLASLATKTEA